MFSSKWRIAMRQVCSALAPLLCTLASLTAHAGQSTKNQYVEARVTDAGLITIYLANGQSITFQDESFLTVKINGKYFSNNTFATLPAPPTPGMEARGSTTKIGDTIRTTWANLNGVDVIQDVFPVAFLRSGQIVIRIFFKNVGGASAIPVQAQYLLDTKIIGNDAAKVLTASGYRQSWSQFVTPNIPNFFIAFEKDLPNAPSFDPGASGQGYFTSPLLKLKTPTRVTIGNWQNLVNYTYGSGPISSQPYGDSGVLLEWGGTSVNPGQTIEGGSTSFGTGEFVICAGNMFSLSFYPSQIKFNRSSGSYVPNPFPVETYLFNIDQNQGATATKLTLEVGPSLNIVGPAAGKSVTQDVGSVGTPGMGGFIDAQGVASVTWQVQADKYTNCNAPLESWMRLSGQSSFGPPTLTECDLPVQVECADQDLLPPLVDTRKVLTVFKKSALVHDDRADDVGLKSITPASPNLSNFTIAVTPPISGCSKIYHAVTVTQKDSTKGGCVFFTFLDCAGNLSYDTVCFDAHIVPNTPDVADPQLYITGKSGSFDGSECNVRCYSLTATDSVKYDRGIAQVIPTPGFPVTNMNLTVPNFPKGSSAVNFSICVQDSMLDGAFSVRIVDVADHFVDSVFRYCTLPDVNPPTLAVTQNGRTYKVHVEETRPWDRGIDQILLSPLNNMLTNPTPTQALTRGQRVFDFDISVADTTRPANSCVVATDLASHKTGSDCQIYTPASDIWKPNITLDPPASTNPTCVDVYVDDIHVFNGDTIRWDRGIDSVWLTNVRGMTIPFANRSYQPPLMRIPVFRICVTDTTDLDSLACVTIRTRDSAKNQASYQWCFPYSPDNNSPLLSGTSVSHVKVGVLVTDEANTDRGLKHITLLGVDNLKPINITLKNDRSSTFDLDVIDPGKSSVGTVYAIDTWGESASTPAVKTAHSAEIDASFWVQNLSLKNSYLIEKAGDFELPIRFVANDTFALVRKGISEFEFSFQLVGDLEIAFLDVVTAGTASAGWSVTPTVVGNMITINGKAPNGVILTDATLPLAVVRLHGKKDDNTKSTQLEVLNGGEVTFNGDRNVSVTGRNASLTLPAPRGSISGSTIVVIGACAPVLKSGVKASVAMLSPVTPNPVTNNSTFEYAVPHATNVRIELYNALGEKVKSLFTGIQDAGRYSVTFDAGGLATGTYYLRMQTNDSLLSRSVVVRR